MNSARDIMIGTAIMTEAIKGYTKCGMPEEQAKDIIEIIADIPTRYIGSPVGKEDEYKEIAKQAHALVAINEEVEEENKRLVGYTASLVAGVKYLISHTDIDITDRSIKACSEISATILAELTPEGKDISNATVFGLSVMCFVGLVEQEFNE